MKKSIFAFSGLLLFLCTCLSTAVFAEEHAYAAIEHTSAAIAQGQAGNADDAKLAVIPLEKALGFLQAGNK